MWIRINGYVDQDSNMRSLAPEAVVRVLTQSAWNLLNPVIMQDMANSPKYSGQRQNSEDWFKNWGRLLQVVKGIINGCTLPENVVTEILLQ